VVIRCSPENEETIMNDSKNDPYPKMGEIREVKVEPSGTPMKFDVESENLEGLPTEEEIEEYIQSLVWDKDTPDYMIATVSGNIRVFYNWMKTKMINAKNKDGSN